MMALALTFRMLLATVSRLIEASSNSVNPLLYEVVHFGQPDP